MAEAPEPTSAAPSGKEPEAGWAAELLYPAELLIEKIGDAASRVATVAAGREEASAAPVSETTEEQAGLLTAYTPHIMIASTVIGLGMFAYWVAMRPSRLPAPPGFKTSGSGRGPRTRNARLSDYEQGFYAGLHDATTIGKAAAQKKIDRLVGRKPAKYVSGYREGLRQGMQTLRWKPNPRRGPQERHYKLNMWEQLHEALELREQVSLTQLAENAAWDMNEDWRLDDELDPVWDWAIEVMDSFEREHGVRMSP